ncbi:F-box domain-containing protein [Favolaschia claudopus]|uniref:F-box domain-containing protein n=1 Tax=Favolaschia claudopus TaxID=2862362 RepID=A0AAW0A328_9AGAR
MSESQTLSVAQLQAHIDDLNSAIEAQKLVLNDLMTRRSEFQRRLNGFLDPMTRLPFEIQCLIFLQVPADDAEDCPPKPASSSPPMALLNVCRLWRDIALSTPALWAKLQMDSLPRGPNFSELCKLWFERARTLPLSLMLNGSSRLEQSVQDLMTQYGPRLEELRLHLLFEETERPYVSWVRDAGSLSSLKTLSIDPTDDEPYYGDMREWLGLLRDAPALSLCTLSNVFYEQGGNGDGDLNSLTLRSLRILRLGKPHANDAMNFLNDRGSSSVIMLRYLTLPALKTLTVSELDITDEEFLSFLLRSSPPLESVEMTLSFPNSWPDSVVSRCLRLMPMLTTLDLVALPRHYGVLTDPFLPFIEVLSTSHDVVPTLRQLIFRTDIPVTVHYDELLRMLQFRRLASCPTPLERFELRFIEYWNHDYSPDIPPEDVRFRLWQLTMDGLKIHIGHTQNLV